MNYKVILDNNIHLLYITLLSGGRVTRVVKYKQKYLIGLLPGKDQKTYKSLMLLEPIGG